MEAPGLVSDVLGEVARLRESGLAPAPFLSGDDLIGIGFVPGPGLGTVLHELYDRQLEGRLSDRNDAIAAARALFDRDA